MIDQESIEKANRRPSEIVKRTSQRKLENNRLKDINADTIKQLQELKGNMKNLTNDIKEAELKKFGKRIDLNHLINFNNQSQSNELYKELIKYQDEYNRLKGIFDFKSSEFEKDINNIRKSQTEVLSDSCVKNKIILMIDKKYKSKDLNQSKDSKLEKRYHKNISKNQSLHQELRLLKQEVDKYKSEEILLSRKDTNLYEVLN